MLKPDARAFVGIAQTLSRQKINTLVSLSRNEYRVVAFHGINKIIDRADLNKIRQ